METCESHHKNKKYHHNSYEERRKKTLHFIPCQELFEGKNKIEQGNQLKPHPTCVVKKNMNKKTLNYVIP
jgi:hypothetical protein